MRPVSTRIILQVFFPPRSLHIELERSAGDSQSSKFDRAKAFKNEKKFKDETYRIAVAGEYISLTCVAGKRTETANPLLISCWTRASCRGALAGSSRPRPLLTWLEDDHHVVEANRTEFTAAQFGGEQTRSVIQFTAAARHNGKQFQCHVYNPTIGQPHKLIERINLVVLCT